MKRTLLIGLGLLVVLISGVYLAQRRTNVALTSSDTAATSSAPSDTPATGRGTAVIPEEGTVTLGLGETAAFRGFLITPTEVVEDSRCPAGVYCIQAGTLRLKIAINSSLGTTTKIVKLGDSQTVGNEVFTFSAVDPLKTAKPIADTEYRFTVLVKRTGNAS